MPRVVREKQSGFTLSELMVVIVIVGIVSAIAAPAFIKTMEAGRAARASRGLVEVMRYAQSEAQSQNRAMRIQLFPSTTGVVGGSITVVAGASSTCSGVFPAGLPGSLGTYTYAASAAGSDVAFDKVTGPTDLCLKPTGELFELPARTYSDGTTLEVATIRSSSRKNVRTIRLGPNGSARVK